MNFYEVEEWIDRKYVGLVGIIFVNPKDKGGLGIKNLESFNDSLLCKWKWRCLNDLSASWFNLLHFRYGSFAANFLYGEGRESLKHASIWWRDMWKTGGAEEGG